MRRQTITGLRMTAALIVLLGLLYPLVVTGVAQIAFKHRADGSLVKDSKGDVVGSSLVGQLFVDANDNPDPKYFQPRPSAAGTNGYDPLGPSGGTNLGPSNPKLLDAVAQRVSDYRTLNGLDSTTAVPVDAVTASASGLDPHISVANANLQAARVANGRNLSIDLVQSLIGKHTEGRQWGVLGEKVVNVLELNLDLDQQG
jgi:K+-transporting ATPase ATPase C chain